MIAVATVATGGAAIAFGVAGGSGTTGGHHAAGHGPRHAAAGAAPERGAPAQVLQAAPILIPPEPSTTDTTTASYSGRVGGPAPRWATAVVPPVVNSAPSTISDPSVVATSLVSSLPLYNTPGAPAPAHTLPNPNYLGAPLVLLVTGYQNGWVQAYVPLRPNEATAWIPSADVTISFVSEHIVISLGARVLTLYRSNVPVFQTSIAPGAPSSPTPTGSFFVAYIVKLTDPTNVYGPYAMGTSAFSNTYYSFDGGPGQVGIHGTNQPWVIGSYASHGCVRLNNTAITTLAQEVEPGTPVEIGP